MMSPGRNVLTVLVVMRRYSRGTHAVRLQAAEFLFNRSQCFCDVKEFDKVSPGPTWRTVMLSIASPGTMWRTVMLSIASPGLPDVADRGALARPWRT